MNPGKLRDRVTLLRLTGGADLSFTKAAQVWAQVRETGRKNIFAKVGIGSDGVEIVLREREITLHDAILWNGRHYFLTNIAREGTAPAYLKIQAARVPCRTAEVYRCRTERGKTGQPVNFFERVGSFPACLTEKYLGSAGEQSHMESETRLVAVAPKAAACKAGDLFAIDGKRYRVMVVHDLEDWKIEYEIERAEDD